MIPVHIAGVGMTQFGKSSQTLVEIMRAAAVSVLSTDYSMREHDQILGCFSSAIQISPTAPF